MSPTFIRLLRPQVVLTFDPIGGYRHPDHIAIHNAHSREYQMAADAVSRCAWPGAFKPDKLYFIPCRVHAAPERSGDALSRDVTRLNSARIRISTWLQLPK
jgi:LmbE family N-acetylglucosaminyl deacetylase